MASSVKSNGFFAPFEFVLKSGYWGGLLTRLIALYSMYILLGMIPYGMIFITSTFFKTLSGNSLEGFYYAAGLFISLNLAQRTLDMVGKMLSRYIANDQGIQVQETIIQSIKYDLEKRKSYKTLSEDEKAKIRDKHNKEKNSDLNNEEFSNLVQKEITDLEKKEKGAIGSKMTDQEKVFQMVNKISEQALQSIASIVVNLLFLVNIGMTQAALAIFAATLAINGFIINYAISVIKPIDKKAVVAKGRGRTNWTELVDTEEPEEKIEELEDNLKSYSGNVVNQIGHDFMVDVFNNCIRYCALPLGIFIAVFSLAGGTFPITNIVLSSGTTLTAAIIMGTASAIEKLIQDTSVFAKSYQELYQSGSNYENVNTLMKRGSIDVTQLATKFTGKTRQASIIKHIMYHGFVATFAWACLSAASDLITIGMNSAVVSHTPLLMLMPTLMVGLVAYIGMDRTYSNKNVDVHDYTINSVLTAILSATTLIVATGNASIFAAILQIAPTFAQQANLALCISAIYYTASSALTFYLKPSTKQLDKTLSIVQNRQTPLKVINKDSHINKANEVTDKVVHATTPAGTNTPALVALNGA